MNAIPSFTSFSSPSGGSILPRSRLKLSKPAAVLEADDARAEGAARVVPVDAQRVTLGKAVLGYHKRGGKDRLATVRLREVERIIALRYGPQGCDTDDGGAYAIVAAHALIPRLMMAHAGRPAAVEMVQDRFVGWCGKFLPSLDLGEIRRIADRAVREPRRFRADTAARLLCLTLAERTAAKVSTIGAVDCSAEERKALSRAAARERDRVRKAELRRAAGARTQEEVQANSVASRCRELGISRATYYRRLKAGKINDLAPRDTRVHPHYIKGNIVLGRDCLTPSAAQPTSKGEPFRYYPGPVVRSPAVNPSAARARDGLAGPRPWADPGEDRGPVLDAWLIQYVRDLHAC